MKFGKQILWICSFLQALWGCPQSKAVIFCSRAIDDTIWFPKKLSYMCLYGQNWPNICVIASTMPVGRRVFVIWSLATWIWWPACAKECNWDDVPGKWMSFKSPFITYFLTTKTPKLGQWTSHLHHYYAVQGGPAVHHHWSIVPKLWRLQVK